MKPQVGTDPSTGDWQLRWIQAGDAEAIVDLLDQVYGGWGSLEDWSWKYRQPPVPFCWPSVVAELDGRLIGHYGLLPLELVWDGQVVPGAQAVDAAVLPAYRRRGLFMAMARRALDGATQAGAVWIYAFPGLFSLTLNQRLGYRPAGFVPELLRVLQPRRALALALRLLPGDLRALWTAGRTSPWPAHIVPRLARLRRSLLLLAAWVADPVVARPDCFRRQEPLDLTLRTIEQFDGRFDRLWSQVQEHTALGVKKDARYLAWRYRLNSGRRYQAIVAERGGQLLGFVLVRHAGHCSDVAELLSLPGREDVLPPLLAEAIEQARAAGSMIMRAWARPQHPHYACLRQFGFVSSRRLHRLAERWPALGRQFYQVIVYGRHLPPDQEAQLVARSRTGSLAMGDSDLV